MSKNNEYKSENDNLSNEKKHSEIKKEIIKNPMFDNSHESIKHTSDIFKELVPSVKSEIERSFKKNGIKEQIKEITDIAKSINMEPFFESYNQAYADTITKNMGIIQKAINSLSKSIGSQAQEMMNTSDKLANLQWTIGGIDNIGILNSLVDINDKSEIDTFMLNLFERNDYALLFDEIDKIINSLDYGFKNLLIQVKSILEHDISNFKVVIPPLFSILEYIYVKKSNNNKYSMGYTTAENDIERIKEMEDDSSLIFLLLSSYKVLLYMLDNGEKSGNGFDKGIDAVKYSRHSVLHGRYNPDRLTEVDLIQLILLISSLDSSFELMKY